MTNTDYNTKTEKNICIDIMYRTNRVTNSNYFFFFFIIEFVPNNFCNFYSFLQSLHLKNVTRGFTSKINK